MNRLEALRAIDQVLADMPLIVTCGATARELAHASRRPSHLYLLDSMGLASAIALGLALGGIRVAAIEGDGSLLMGLTAIPSIAYHHPPGFTLIILDNHEHASADSFPTQSTAVDLADAVRGFGFFVSEAADDASLRDALEQAKGAEGPSVVVGTIEAGNTAGVPFLLEDPAVLGHRFRTAIGRQP